MTDKELYEILNDIEINEEDFIYENVSEIEKQKYKKNLKKKLTKKNYKRYVGIAALAGIALTSGIFIAKPALAYGIPILGDILLEKKIENKEYEKYTEVIGQTKKSGDIEITLVSAVADRSSLELSYEIKDAKGRLGVNSPEFNKIIHSSVGQLFINDKSVMESGSGTWKPVDENTLKIYSKYNLTENNYNDTINLNLKLKELLGEKNDLGFKFTLDMKEMNKNSIFLKDVKTNNNNIKINSVHYTPLNFVIRAEIKGFDELIVIDNNGNPLTKVGGSYNGSSKESRFDYVPNENMKWVECIPVISNEDNAKNGMYEKTYLDPIDFDLNFKNKILKINDYRDVEIGKVIKDGDHLIILHKDLISKNFYNFSKGSLYIKDGEKIIESKNDEETYKKFAKYQMDDYDMSYYKLDNFDNLKIGVSYLDIEKFLSKESFKIKLK